MTNQDVSTLTNRLIGDSQPQRRIAQTAGKRGYIRRQRTNSTIERLLEVRDRQAVDEDLRVEYFEMREGWADPEIISFVITNVTLISLPSCPSG